MIFSAVGCTLQSLKIHPIRAMVRAHHVDIHCAEQVVFSESNWIEFSNFVWCVYAFLLCHSVSDRCMWYQQLNAVITTKLTVYFAKQTQTKNRSKCRQANEKLYLNIWIWIWSEKMSVDIFLSTAKLAKTNRLLLNSFSIRLINYPLSLSFHILLETHLMARKCLYDFQSNIDRFFVYL